MMEDWDCFIRNILDPDIGYEQFWDYIDWVTYGWINEPTQSDDEVMAHG